MKRIESILIIVLLLFSLSNNAQDTQKDSLMLSITNSEADTNKVNTLNALSNLIYRTNPTEAIEYATEARDLAKTLNHQPGLALAIKNIGLGYYFLGNYFEASIQWEQSLDIYELLNDKTGIANLISNLGVIYDTQGNSAKATEYYLRSLKIAEESGDSLRIATCLLNIAYVYSGNLITLDKAFEYNLQAFQISENINDPYSTGTSALNLGDIYYQKGEYDSALFYYQKSLMAFNNSIDAAVSLNYIGKVYAEKGDYESAIEYQNQSYEIAQKFDAKLEMVQALLGVADTYFKADNDKLAISYFKKAQNIAQEIGSDHEIKDAYEGLATAYAEISDYKNAFQYQRLYSILKDTLYNIETSDKIKNLHFTYQIEKKEDEIKILEINSELEQLKIKRQKIISLATGSTGILLLILAIVLYNRFSYTRKTKKIIEKEKDRSDKLLLNILPAQTAEELKRKGKAKARKYDMVSIMFTDFKGFTSIAANLDPEVLVSEVNKCYKKFDEIITKYGIEKIKTIGDAYMAAAGLPVVNNTHAMDIVNAAIEIRDYMQKLKDKRQNENKLFFEIRIGIHSGPVVAGIVGTKKFAYDIWGDTVNIASRMESNSDVGKINISETTYQLVKEKFKCISRGDIEAKNRGKMKMYFLEAPRSIKNETVF